MRTIWDRLRQALIGLALVIPLNALIFGIATLDFGIVAVAALITSTIWVYAFNLIFDRAMKLWCCHKVKSTSLRLVHAMLWRYI